MRREGHSPNQGGSQMTSGGWNCLEVNCGHAFANTVRLFYMNERDCVIAVFGSPVILLTKTFVGYE